MASALALPAAMATSSRRGRRRSASDRLSKRVTGADTTVLDRRSASRASAG
jgi:hypothetical protein